MVRTLSLTLATVVALAVSAKAQTTLDNLCLLDDFARFADSIYSPDTVWVTGGSCDSVTFRADWTSPTTGIKAQLKGIALKQSTCRLYVQFFLASGTTMLFDSTFFVCSDPAPESLEDVCLATDFADWADSLYNPDTLWVTGGGCDSISFTTIWTSPTTGTKATLRGTAQKLDPCSLYVQFLANPGTAWLPVFDSTFYMCRPSTSRMVRRIQAGPLTTTLRARFAGDGTVLIAYSFVRDPDARIEIRDLRGRLVAQWTNLALPVGSVLWRPSAAQRYLCSLTAGGTTRTVPVDGF